MSTLQNDFKNTGIKGINVSWRQDVQPLLVEMKKSNWNVVVTRETGDGKSCNYKYIVTLTNSTVEVFRTNSVATVWMYLCGLMAGSKSGRAAAGQDTDLLEELKTLRADKQAAQTQLSLTVAENERLKSQATAAGKMINQLRTGLIDIKKLSYKALEF